jgi:hypothetical protein
MFSLGILSRQLKTPNAYSNAGGTIEEAGGYRFHIFTTSGSIYFSNGGNIQLAIVGGGGGGANASSGGGGGSGGLVYFDQLSIGSGTYNIIVGSGGAGGA